jgi:N-acyl-D-amino-acid deacylase
MIVIKNSTIIDGSGGKPFEADILIKKDKIVATGKFPHKAAEEVIDGTGMITSPGFIDVNTDSDHYLTLFTNPSQSDFLGQGVTTIIGGNCGSSLAPLLYGSLESVRKWADINQVSVNWHTMHEYLATLESRKLGINFGTLVGHSTIRRAILGEALRDLTDNEIKIFEKLITTALKEGALGVSTGLGYAHSRQTPYGEIKKLAQVVKKFDGVYATHLRDEKEGLSASINETIRLYKETGVSTLISHFRPLIGFEIDYEEALKNIARIPGMHDIHFDNYPFDVSIVPIYTLLPEWAKNGGLETMRSNLKTPHLRDRIRDELPNIEGNDIQVAQAPTAEYLINKTLGNFSKNQDVGVKEGLIRLMLASNLRAVVFYKNISLELLIQGLGNAQGLIASNSASGGDDPARLQHERAINTFPKFLQLVKEKSILSQEKAIQKITNTPAQKFHLEHRGIIKNGYYADITMMKEGNVVNVVVNGKIALRGGEDRTAQAGKILRRVS